MLEDLKYPNGELIYEDDTIMVAETGRDYDFVATVINKTNKKIKIVFTGNNECLETIKLDKNGTEYDWCGFFNDNWWATETYPDISHQIAFMDKDFEVYETFDTLDEVRKAIKENYTNKQIIHSYVEAIENFDISSDDIVDAILNSDKFLSINNFGYDDVGDLLEV